MTRHAKTRLAVLWASLAVLAPFSAPSAHAGAWQPPLGIPAPPFGIVETAGPATHIVNQKAPCDDGGTGLGTLPRCTIPNPIPAGAVVELRGTYDVQYQEEKHLLSLGTAAAPAFIRGGATRPRVTSSFEIKGNYLVIENIEFAMAGPDRSVFFVSPASHVVVRHCEVRGNLSAGGIGMASWHKGQTSSNIVIWDNKIHDNGDVHASYDQDVHGIVVGGLQSGVWIVDNEIYRNSGDGLQINSHGSSHHIYAGRNTTYENKQTGLSSKNAVDVVFSQNHSYAHRASNSSNGACLGYQYNPDRIWFLFNRLHDCDYGIAGEADLKSGGQSVYVVGNLIYNIHVRGAFNPNTGWQHAAVRLTGGTHRYVVGNTMHDVDTGIASPGDGDLHIHSNLISGVTRGSHVFVEQFETSDDSTIDDNLFEGRVRIKWGSNTAVGLGALKRATGKCGDCLDEKPLFVNQAEQDFRLQPGSKAENAGVLHSVYATFRERYGVDIARDITGLTRPQGDGTDIGAYESVPAPPPVRSP
jgi:hypothetical protein